MFLESSVVHINYTKASCLPFSKLDPIHSLGKLHGFCYFIIAHTQPFFSWTPSIKRGHKIFFKVFFSYYQKWIKITICQSDSSVMILNCLTVSNWVLSSICQVYHKLAKNLFPRQINRPDKNTAEIWCFTPFSVLQYFQ